MEENNKKITFLLLLGMLMGLMLIGCTTPQIVSSYFPNDSTVLCGEGSVLENYGFSYTLQQPHWTVNWEKYVSQETVDQVDIILDKLYDDNIAQTMILFIPYDEVGDRVNCAVHFLRYMELGLPEGERKDNGFTFLIVVDDDKIDVHYGVGLGLPALTAQGLTPLNRLAEDTYLSSGDMDEALITLVKEFDEYARSKYEPYRVYNTNPTATMIDPISLTTTSGCIITCIVCVGVLIVIVLLFTLSRFGGSGGRGGGGGGFRIYPTSRPFTTSRPFRRWSSGGSSRPIVPRIRGGGGSGRSSRGN